MINLADFIILALATWRLASLFVQEDGPFLLFRRIRELAGIEHDEDGLPYKIPDNFMAGILSCVWCASIWSALSWAVFYFISPLSSMAIAFIFALSAGAIFLDGLVNKK